MDNRPPARLTEPEAIGIAQRVDASEMYRNALSVVERKVRNDRVIWEISSLTMGTQLVVVIDDETGNIVESGYVGVR